jgi:hypothetical protein
MLGLVLMSERELQRVEFSSKVVEWRMTRVLGLRFGRSDGY